MLHQSVCAAVSATNFDIVTATPAEVPKPIGNVLEIRHTLLDSTEPDLIFALIHAEQAAWDAFNATMDVEEQAVTAFDKTGWSRQPRVLLGWYRSLYDANFDPVPDDQGEWKPDYISWAQAEQADRDYRDWAKAADVSDERRAELFAKADRQLAQWTASRDADAAAIDAARETFGIDEAGAAMRAAGTAAFEALNTLCNTPPTTAAGLLAMLDVCWARNVDSIDEEASSSISGVFAAVRSFLTANDLSRRTAPCTEDPAGTLWAEWHSRISNSRQASAHLRGEASDAFLDDIADLEGRIAHEFAPTVPSLCAAALIEIYHCVPSLDSKITPRDLFKEGCEESEGLSIRILTTLRTQLHGPIRDCVDDLLDNPDVPIMKSVLHRETTPRGSAAFLEAAE